MPKLRPVLGKTENYLEKFKTEESIPLQNCGFSIVLVSEVKSAGFKVCRFSLFPKDFFFQIICWCVI